MKRRQGKVSNSKSIWKILPERRWNGQFIVNLWKRKCIPALTVKVLPNIFQNMISRLTLSYLILSTNLIWYSGGIAFHFAPVKSKVESISLVPIVQVSRWRQIFHRSSVSMSVVYVFFVAYRLYSEIKGVESIEELEKSLGSLMQLIYVLACYTIGVFFNIQNVLKPDLTPHLIAEYIKFFRSIFGQ